MHDGAACMTVLSAALLWATVVTPGWSALGFGLALGAAGGSVRTLAAATVPRVFGTRSLGSVRGLLVAFSVSSTAFGRLLRLRSGDVRQLRTCARRRCRPPTARRRRRPDGPDATARIPVLADAAGRLGSSGGSHTPDH